MLNKHTDLPTEQEETVSTVIGCAIAVHRALGPGFKECIYHLDCVPCTGIKCSRICERPRCQWGCC